MSHPAVEAAAAEPIEAGVAIRRTRLGVGFLSVYGAGAIVDATSAIYLAAFLLFYLTAVCGLSGAAAGVALAIALVVDSAVDPLMGSLSDNLSSRLGRRHPFLIASAIPIALALGLLFSIPHGLKGLSLFLWATGFTLAIRIGLSAYNVPYIALGAEVTEEYQARSTVVAWRIAIGAVGTVTALVLGYGVFLSGPRGGLLNRSGHAPFAWWGALLLAVAGLLCGLGTLSARRRLHLGAAARGPALVKLVRELREVFKNRSFLILFAACLVFFVAQGAAGALAQHANFFFWRLTPRQMLIISLMGPPGLVVGITIVAALGRAGEKRSLVIAGLLLICACQFAPVALRLTGVISPNGFAPLATLGIASLLAGAGVTMAVVGFQSMMADAADEHELLFGARREGLYFAGLSFSAKASSGLGGLIGGISLDLIGIPRNIAGQSAALHISWSGVRDLGLIYGPIAAVITSASVLIVLGYRIDRRAHRRILEKLAARRSSEIGVLAAARS
ncbi:MAG: MFS transporter [Caulobacteraceae bacterium]